MGQNERWLQDDYYVRGNNLQAPVCEWVAGREVMSNLSPEFHIRRIVK